MGQWQFAEDAARLPEGMKRVGYDADTGRYTFLDREGNMYIGPPHEEYGSLTLIGKSGRLPPSGLHDRPNAFASERSRPGLSVEVDLPQSTATFHDILPAHLITSPSSADSRLSPASPGSDGPAAGARLRDAVRRVKLPAMQNVVTTIRRATTVRKPRNTAADGIGEGVGLLRGGSLQRTDEQAVKR